ncbi:plasmid mobilization relaxosome protein MobC [Aestuariispira insulae]|nr:plasmid mobilization relaxosome protein MobC [Aestuariispira insulae]
MQDTHFVLQNGSISKKSCFPVLRSPHGYRGNTALKRLYWREALPASKPRSFRIKDPSIAEKLDSSPNVSRVLNDALRQYFADPLPVDDYREEWVTIRKQVSGIARNINQIATVANAHNLGESQMPPVEALEAANDALRPLIQRLNFLISHWG